MVIEYNTKPTLMIHSFKAFNNNLGLIGDSSPLELESLLENGQLKRTFVNALDRFGYITFDDGLYQQIELIKLFPKDKVIFFPSFGLLRPELMPPNPIDNSIAHRNKKSSLSTFITSTEAWDLMQSGYKLGMHGWYHLNLNLNRPDINNGVSPLRIIKDDARKCTESYMALMKKHIIQNSTNINQLKILVKDNFPTELVFHYCTPYNIMNDYQKLYIQFLSAFIAQVLETDNDLSDLKDIPKKLIIFSHERISIENFIKEYSCHYVKD